MHKLAISAVLFAFLASPACVNERTYFDPTQGLGIAKGASDPGFSGGRLTGDLGPIQSFDDQRASVNGTTGDEFGGSSSVTVTGAAPTGTGFVIIDMYTLDLRNADAGTYTADSAEMADVGVTVCSDSNDGSIHFDGPAEEATVVIEDIGADTRQVTVDSSIRAGFESMGELTTQRAAFRLAR
jgi:hypothetical protein